MDYSIYIAHDAENLQFYIWLQDYTKRFNALPEEHRKMSPEWKPIKTYPLLRTGFLPRETKSDFDELGNRYLSTCSEAEEDQPPKTPPKDLPLSLRFNHRLKQLTHKPHDTIPKRMPCSPITSEQIQQLNSPKTSPEKQPFREEINRVIAHYLTCSAPRELNLSQLTRCTLMHALDNTTHPSAFAPILASVSTTLRLQSHPNFMRWSTCNGNKPRTIFFNTLALAFLTFCIFLGSLLVFSSHSRYWRTTIIPPLFLAIVTLVAAHNGLCIILWREAKRELHPWEILLPHEDPAESYQLSLHKNQSVDSSFSAYLENGVSYPADKFAPFGANKNSWANDARVALYERWPVWKQLNVKKVRVQEEGLRFMQNQIVKQAHAWGFIVTTAVVIGVCAIPEIGFYG